MTVVSVLSSIPAKQPVVTPTELYVLVVGTGVKLSDYCGALFPVLQSTATINYVVKPSN